jgi:hypothetical protein
VARETTFRNVSCKPVVVLLYPVGDRFGTVCAIKLRFHKCFDRRGVALGMSTLVNTMASTECLIRTNNASTFDARTAQVLKHRYERVPPPYRRRMRNVLTFLYSGLYNITYPKTGLNRGRSDSTSSVATANGVSSSAHTHGHAHGGECQLILCDATCTIILKCMVRLLANVLTVSRGNARFRGEPLFLHRRQRCLPSVFYAIRT